MRQLDESERARLKDICVIDDPDSLSIFAVMGRMEVLDDFFSVNEEFHSLRPFINAYHRITKGVVDAAVEDDRFDDFATMQRLDVRFAQLYFEPLYTFLTTGEAEKPWKTYFGYCQRDDSKAIAEMTLGINAHINADLLRVLAEMEYDEKADYDAVNPILRYQLFRLLIQLALEDHDRLSFEAICMKPLTAREFKNNIVRWRREVWHTAHDLEDVSMHWDEVCAQTESIAEDIVDIVHEFRMRELPSTIKRVHGLGVRLD